jgi:hypothetical protein
MSVQLIISGDHATDLIAEINNLHSALNPKPAKTSAEKPVSEAKTEAEPVEEEKSEPAEKPKVAPKKKKLTAKEQDAVVEKAIADGGIEEEDFEALTQKRQKQVTDALEAKPVEETSDDSDDDFDGMFDDEPDTGEEVTRDTIREIMAEKGKDDDGNQIQDNLISMQEIFKKFVPEGEKVKVGNVPDEKLPELAAELRKVGE